MQFFRSSLSRLAIATTLIGTSFAIAPHAAEARQPCGSFTINWGGTISQRDMLKCAVEYNTGAGRSDRYYLEIKKDKIRDNFQSFEISFPKDFDGSVDAEKIRVLVNGKRVELNTAETAWDPDKMLVTGATQSQAIVENLETTSQTNSSPNRGGELVLVNGELVFLDAAALAEQQAIAAQNQSSTTVNEEATSMTDETAAQDDDEPRSRSLLITLAEPIEKESAVEIILDDVRNPSSGGIYVVTAFARSKGAPLPDRLGAWLFDVEH